MHFLITGGTGFIGAHLCQALHEKNHQITVLTRNRKRATKKLPAGIDFIESFDALPNLEPIDIVINLAGHPIANSPWFAKVKQAILDSRIKLTNELIEALSKLAQKPKCFISGSAIGYYGVHEEKSFIETDEAGEGFAAELCKNWEEAAQKAKTLGMRLCLIRTGLVLGEGGLLQRMRLPFKLGLGGKLGHGKQWMSWIHMQDYLNIILTCIENEALEGAINATAPNPVTNQEFSKTYASVLNRPAFMPMPAFVLKTAFGQMAQELILSGQRVIPQKLIELNFQFNYPSLKDALSEIEGH